ncbi:MAG: VWA domain-containing protein [Ignavibacteriota bacterium]
MKRSNWGRTRQAFLIRVRPLFLLAGSPGLVLGQNPPTSAGGETGLRISVDVKLVVLNVSVRDRKGGIVPRLEERNFHLEENGRPQTIRAFQSAGSPVAVGLLVDSSRSMRSKRPEVVEAAARFARLSDPRDELFIVNFNDRVNFGFPDTKLLATSPDDLARALLSPIADGRTSLYDAVGKALAHIRSSPIERKVLLVISDGGDNASKITQAEVLQDIARSDVEIYTIVLYDEDDPDLNVGAMRRIAAASGGQFFRPKVPGEAVEICERIAADIRTQYVLSYSPSNQNFCGEYRTIKLLVTADRGGRLVSRTRAGYTALSSTGSGGVCK